MKHKTLALLLFFISSFAIASNQIVYMEPETVTLTGNIITLKFPGPPNYESIKNGDTAEIGPYLVLDKPINLAIKAKSSAQTDEPQKNVQLIQLVVTNNDWKSVKQGNRVEVTGTLFTGFTGHHHARALLNINTIKIISKKQVDHKILNQLPSEDKKFLKLQQS